MGDLPFEIIPVEEETNRQLLEDFPGEQTGWLQVGPSKYLLPARYGEYAKDIYNFKVRKDDVWIVTFPRSGTTLTQDMMWLIMNQFDFESCKKINLLERFPHLELFSTFDTPLVRTLQAEVAGTPLEPLSRTVAESILPAMEAAPSPRLIKSHLGLSLLPPGLVDTCKVVYLCRNPKDLAVSFYYLCRLIRTYGYQGDFPKFWDYFHRGLVRWCPYWAHVAEAWRRRDHPNMLFLFYEDIVKDMSGTVRKMADFLGVEMSSEQLAGTLDHLDIRNFRQNPSVNLQTVAPVMAKNNPGSFIRKGVNGDWSSEFSPEMAARADQWIAENVAKIPGFVFPEVSQK